METNHEATGRHLHTTAPVAPQPQPSPTETPRPGGVLALLRQAAGDAHDPRTCLPRGSFQGEWDLCDGCREALASRIAALAQHQGHTEGKMWLACTVRGLQAFACEAPLPPPVRVTLRPFGPPRLEAGAARYAQALGPGLAADLAAEEEAEDAPGLALWAELCKKASGASRG